MGTLFIQFYLRLLIFANMLITFVSLNPKAKQSCMSSINKETLFSLATSVAVLPP